MISEYLTLSRISSGELEIEPKRVNLYNEVIEKVLDEQKEAMEEKGVSVGIEIPRDLEFACDPEYIQIVYNNLISNAIKYGTANTEIQLGYSGMRDDYHYFSVANVGEWIKESDRKRIFEKYVTLGKRGTGIGLHATREIVKKHGGDIWVEPCYFAKGKCIAEKSIIRKADDKLLTGNNFIFTIHERCLEQKP
jgi:signal transduction histidine kinase